MWCALDSAVEPVWKEKNNLLVPVISKKSLIVRKRTRNCGYTVSETNGEPF